MPPVIQCPIRPTVPTVAVVGVLLLGLVQPFFACALYHGIFFNWGQGEHLAAGVLGFFFLAEFIMLPACWLAFLWFAFGCLRLQITPGNIQLSRCLFGFCLKGESIPLGEHSRFRLMTRRVMSQSLKPQMTLGRVLSKNEQAYEQKEYELGVADAQKFHSIMSVHERHHACALLQELHRAYPRIPADEDGTPISFNGAHAAPAPRRCT